MKNRNFGLDAVRMCAILPVLAVHYSAFAIKDVHPIVYVLGDLGVELFFALSGFLIGGIILREFERGFSWRLARNFYARRWMRTLPLYYVFFVSSAFVTIWGLTLDPAWSTKCLAYLVFLQNLAWPMVDWYQESWSLAVEEWFYLLFPLLFAAMPWCTARRRVLAIALLLIAVPLVLRIASYDQSHVYDLYVRRIVALRLDAIAFGILAIWAVRSLDLRRWGHVIGAAGAAGTIFTIAAMLGKWPISDFFMRTFLLTIGAASFAAIVTWAGFQNMPRLAAVSWFSTRSYALYLCNGTVLRWMIHKGWFFEKVQPLMALAIYAVGCIVIAEAAHRLIEQPFMRRRPKELGGLVRHPGGAIAIDRDGHSAAAR